jgi:uncharacterized protein (TIGR02145 family)
MKKILYFVGLMIAVNFIFTACTCIDVNRLLLNKNTLTLIVGENEKLIATAFGTISNNNIRWTSDNEDVATVDGNGVVTAVLAGTATITVTSACGNYSAICELTVITSPVAGISLNKNTLEFHIDEFERLIATIIPANATNKNVTWASNNEVVATVDDTGMVIAVSIGTAVITVITECGNHTAICVVTVKPILVTDIILNKYSLVLQVDEQETLIATIIPANATNKNVTWASSNPAVATVGSNGEVTAISVGTTTVTATAVENGRTATCLVTVVYIPHHGVIINGVKWAERNVSSPGVFALTPESSGMFYQWNRRTGWSAETPDAGVKIENWDASFDAILTWLPNNDPCPEGWRIPTQAELQSLLNSGSTWTTQNGVNGRKFGTAPNQIFLPAAGCRHFNNGVLSFVNEQGFYWSSTASNDADASNAIDLYFHAEAAFNGTWQKTNGHNVRCVEE